MLHGVLFGRAARGHGSDSLETLVAYTAPGRCAAMRK